MGEKSSKIKTLTMKKQINKIESSKKLIINNKKSIRYTKKKIITFTSINDIIYLIYNTTSNIFLYNLLCNQIISKIGICYTQDMRYILDKFNKKDLLLIVKDRCLQLLDLKNLEIILKIRIKDKTYYDNYEYGSFITEINKINIIASYEKKTYN